MKTPHTTTPKMAIVHDWLVGGGAERVVHELHRMFPEAPIYTSYCSDEWRQRLDGKVVTGYLQHWPFSRLRKFLPLLRVKWFESLDFSGYDVVISSSGNGEAKGIKAGSKFHKGQVHVCYCHSPTHFYWRHYDQYLARPGFGLFNPLARLGLQLLVKPLRKWDYRAAQRPDHIIANSTHIQADIRQYYGRDSAVIHPPVDTGRFAGAANGQPRSGFVTVGRQVPQKRTDLIVAACSRLNLPLTVIGGGPEHDRLVRMAGPTVQFLTGDAASDHAVAQALSSAQAFIFAALDDFGITPVEAMAAGTPVIAYRGGGAVDYVTPGVSGEFFDAQTIDSLEQVLRNFDPPRYSAAAIRQHAEQFSAARFQEHLRHTLKSLAGR